MKRYFGIFLLVLLVIMPSLAVAKAKAKARPATISRDPYISAILVDADDGKVLFEENADAQVHPASVLKLMDLYVILNRIEQGKLKLDEMVPVTVEAAKTGGSQVYLDPKEQFTVEEMLNALMVQSANDAAVALATYVGGSKEGFVAMMNEQAKALGMTHTVFHSVHGLPPGAGQEPDVTTARDFSLLCLALLKKPETLKYTSIETKDFRGGKFIMRNHNHLLGHYPGCDGLKTGYYYQAGFSIAATAKKGGVRMLALVMGSSNRLVRDKKAMELLSKGFSMVPPRPESVAVQPAVNTGTTAVGDANTAESIPKTPTEKIGKSSWGIFFIGFGIGIVVLVALLFIFMLFMKRRSGPSLSGRGRIRR